MRLLQVLVAVGVVLAPPTALTAPRDTQPPKLLHEAGNWSISAGDVSCFAQVEAPDARYLLLTAIADRIGLHIGSKGEPLPRGRKAVVETDGYRFEFEPDYSDDGLSLSSENLLPAADVSAWQRAKWFRISADGRPLFEFRSQGDEFFEVIHDVAACAAGQPGWWGEGATQPIRRVR